MKVIHSLLIFSAALNAVFLYLAFASRATPSSIEIDAHSVAGEASTLTVAKISGRATEAGAGELLRDQGSRLAWADLDPSNLDDVSERLKTAGFPRDEIRTIMAVLIREKISIRPEPQPYWRSDRLDYADPKVRQRMQEQMLEQQILFRKYAEGPEHLADDPTALQRARAQYGDLPLEKLQALKSIETDYNELRQKQSTQVRRPGDRGSGERDAFQLLEKEKERDIAALMTPEEYAEYELRSSPAAMRLRGQLETFQPSELEYRTLFALQKPYSERLADPSVAPPQRKALMEQLNSDVVAALGADRAADFLESQRAVDNTARLIARLGLPARVAGEVRNIRDDINQRARAVQNNDTLSVAQRSSQLNALGEQAKVQLTSKLGPKGYEAYHDLKSDWIDALKEPPPGTP